MLPSNQYDVTLLQQKPARKTYYELLTESLNLPALLVFLYSTYNVILGIMEIIFLHKYKYLKDVDCDIFSVWNLILTLGLIRILYCCVDIYFYTVVNRFNDRPLRYDLLLYWTWLWAYFALQNILYNPDCYDIFFTEYHEIYSILVTECVTGIVMLLFWIIMLAYGICRI